MTRVTVRVHLFQVMNAEYRRMAAELWNKPTDLSHWIISDCSSLKHALNPLDTVFL